MVYPREGSSREQRAAYRGHTWTRASRHGPHAETPNLQSGAHTCHAQTEAAEPHPMPSPGEDPDLDQEPQVSRPRGEVWALVPRACDRVTLRLLLAVWPWVSSFRCLRFLSSSLKRGGDSTHPTSVTLGNRRVSLHTARPSAPGVWPEPCPPHRPHPTSRRAPGPSHSMASSPGLGHGLYRPASG